MQKYTAIYVRVSTEEQAKEGYSITAQKDKLINYCRARKWFYKIFEDAGYSASSLKRPAIQVLIQEIKENKVERVVVWKLDRLSRRMSNLYWLVSLFEKYSVELVSITESITTNSALGKLLTGILGSVAEFERETIRERIKSVKDTRKKTKGLPLGHPPFGYSNNWEVIPEQATVVKEIFEMAKFAGLTKIAHILNQRGIKTRDGNPWTKVAVWRILNNCTYAGLLQLDDNSYIRGKFPNIISEQLFFDIQRKIKTRARRRGLIASPHLLTGILQCGLCKKTMLICGDYRFNKAFYVCHTKATKGAGACNNRRFKADFLEGKIKELIFSLLTQERKETIIQTVREKLQNQQSQLLKNQKDAIAKGLSSIKKKIAKLYELFEEENIELEVLLERLETLKAHKQKLQNQLDEIEEKLKDEKIKRTVDLVENAVKNFEKLWNVADVVSKKELLKTIIENIKAYPDKIIIEFVWGETHEILYPRQKKLIELTPFEINELKRSNKTHAKILLLANNGLKAKDIAFTLKMDYSKVVWVISNYRKKGIAYFRNAKELRSNQYLPPEVERLILQNFGLVVSLSVGEVKKFLEQHGFSISYQMAKNITYNFIPNLATKRTSNASS